MTTWIKWWKLFSFSLEIKSFDLIIFTNLRTICKIHQLICHYFVFVWFQMSQYFIQIYSFTESKVYVNVQQWTQVCDDFQKTWPNYLNTHFNNDSTESVEFSGEHCHGPVYIWNREWIVPTFFSPKMNFQQQMQPSIGIV